MNFTEEEGLKDFELFRKSIEMIYGKNYFIDYEEDDKLDIHLYFEDITIKNSDNITHNIKDLFVIIRFNSNGGDYELSNTLYGYRTFITQNEANNHYLHSHLSDEGEFCLGSGPLKLFMSDYGYSMTIDRENIDIFDEMLLMIFHYVRWESMEGTPYRYINRLVSQQLNNQYVKINTEDISLINKGIDVSCFEDEFIAKLFTSSTDIKLDVNKYRLKFDSEKILQYYNEGCFSRNQSRNLILYKGTDGFLYKNNENSCDSSHDPYEVMGESDYLPDFPITLESGKIIAELSTEEGGENEEIKFIPFVNKGFLTNVIKYIEECVSSKM